MFARALLNFSVSNKVRVIEKYLEKGRIQMRAGSMHSCLERQLNLELKI
jgi:hypothetical protein